MEIDLSLSHELQRIEAEKVSISEKLGVLDTVLVKVRERDLQERQEAEAKERAKQIASAQKVAKKLVASAAKVDFALKTLNAAFSELEGCTTNYQQALQRAGLQDHARLRNGLAYACKRGFYSSAPGLAKLVGAEYVRSARRENLENALSSLIIDEVK